MKTSIAIGALGLALCVAAAALVWRPLDHAHMSPAIGGRLRTLSALDFQLGETVLALRSGRGWSYDPLVRTASALEREIAAIDALILDTERLPVEARARWKRVRSALESQQTILEQFKSTNSILRNSLRYLPTAAAQAAAELRRAGREREATEVESSLRAVLVQLSDRDSSASESSLHSLDVLEKGFSPGLPTPDAPEVFVRHARTLLTTHAQTEGLIDELLTASTRDEIASLSEALERLYKEDLARSEHDRVILSALALALAMIIGVTLVRLWLRGVALRRINETLEERVKQRSAQLVQAQKLEAVGRLAAGIAHEINTPAQFIGDNLRFLGKSVDDVMQLLAKLRKLLSWSGTEPPPTRADLERLFAVADIDYLEAEMPSALAQSREGVERISAIVRAMRQFARPSDAQRTHIDLNQVIESSLVVSRSEWKTVATIRSDLDPELPSVPAHEMELNQAILAILVNAAQAIASTGRDDASGTIVVTTRRVGAQVEICIRDDGPGMSKEVRARVFDPFFTTRPVGPSSGQGLAIARSIIVDQHGGSIEVESSEGAGAVFRIRLPLK